MIVFELLIFLVNTIEQTFQWHRWRCNLNNCKMTYTSNDNSVRLSATSNWSHYNQTEKCRNWFPYQYNSNIIIKWHNRFFFIHLTTSKDKANHDTESCVRFTTPTVWDKKLCSIHYPHCTRQKAVFDSLPHCFTKIYNCIRFTTQLYELYCTKSYVRFTIPLFDAESCVRFTHPKYSAVVRHHERDPYKRRRTSVRSWLFHHPST